MPSADSNLWWAIENKLAGTGMPYVAPDRRLNLGGSIHAFDDHLPRLYDAGIRAVVCLLNIPGDAIIFQSAGFDFKCSPIPDGFPPTISQAIEIVDFINSSFARNLPVAVFCEAGVGRTGTVIASYLICSANSAIEAIAQVRSIEPAAVETTRQVKFLEEFEKAIK